MRSQAIKRIKLLVLPLALALLFTPVGLAQQQQQGPSGQSLKGAELKGKVPVNRQVLKANLPKPQEARLQNGLRVMLIENHRLPTFFMQMVILSGGTSDPTNKRGLASATAALLREGTEKRTNREIAEQVDALGSTLIASAGLSSLTTVVNTSGLAENLDRTLEVYADVIRNPKFPTEEVEKYKTRLLTQVPVQRSSASFLARERFTRAVYGEEHPAGYIIPPKSSIKNLNTEALARFHSTCYRPNNAILAVTGDISMKELMPKVERAFGDWQKGEVPTVALPPLQPPTKPHIYLIDRPGSVQTSLLLGNIAIERASPDYFAMLGMNHILGADPSSRLFTNLREDKGYTYGANSSFSSSKYPGVVIATAEVRTEVTEGAMKEFIYELKRIGEKKTN